MHFYSRLPINIESFFSSRLSSFLLTFLVFCSSLLVRNYTCDLHLIYGYGVLWVFTEKKVFMSFLFLAVLKLYQVFESRAKGYRSPAVHKTHTPIVKIVIFLVILT